MPATLEPDDSDDSIPCPWALWAFGLSKIQNMFTRNKPQIRAAQPSRPAHHRSAHRGTGRVRATDHLLEVTPENSDPTSLVPGPWPSAWSARSMARGGGLAIFYTNFDLPWASPACTWRSVARPAHRPQQPGQGAAGAHGRAGLRARGYGRFEWSVLAGTRTPSVSTKARCRGAARLATLPPDRRCAATLRNEETPGKWSARPGCPSDRPAACGLTRVWRVWSRCKPPLASVPPEDAEGRADGCRSLLSAVQSLSLAGSAGLQHRGSLLWPLGRETPNSPALIVESELGGSMQQLCSAAAHGQPALQRARGSRRAARPPVAIVLPQRFETAVAHIAIQQIGAVAMPLSLLFGAEALEYRLRDSGAVMAIVACEALPALRQAKAALQALRRVIVVGSVVPTSRPSSKRSAGSTPCRPKKPASSPPRPWPPTRPCCSTPAAPPATPRAP